MQKCGICTTKTRPESNPMPGMFQALHPGVSPTRKRDFLEKEKKKNE
jgi:hypothetical protein